MAMATGVGAEELDVVIAAKGSAELSAFLEAWRPILSHYSLIIVILKEENVQVPPGFLSHLYTPRNIAHIVSSPELASALTISPHACKSFGFLVSTKQFIFTLDTDCSPAKDPITGSLIDPIRRHLKNLTQPATPFFFNTLYDPYRDGTDFVRGYPFSLREGEASAVSHGLWLNRLDFDASTQIVNPDLRNRTYVDTVITIPKGCLFPMSSSNLAFNRKRVGVAMYFGFPILSGSNRYESFDDTWAGLCCKAICDHLGYGVKSGLPYVWRNDSVDGTLTKSLEHVHESVQWLEDLIPFFQTLRFSRTAVSAEDCYLELANQLKEGRLNSVDGIFREVGALMESWIQVWQSHSP